MGKLVTLAVLGRVLYVFSLIEALQPAVEEILQPLKSWFSNLGLSYAFRMARNAAARCS
jgi:hypothetical protein